jgi:beta-phosphoglucomutase-like phosphatase (HAD superfamily)
LHRGSSVSVGEYDAWLFDLDGVITDTASVHAAAWKEMFDDYLGEISEREGTPFTPFEIDPDYYGYVDGKPRYEGVDSFLRSRGIVLRWGTRTTHRAWRRSAASEIARTRRSMRLLGLGVSRFSNLRLSLSGNSGQGARVLPW